MGGGVTRYDGKRFTTYTTEDGLAGNWVRSAIEDREGVLWFGTQGGVTRYDGANFAPESMDTENRSRLPELVEILLTELQPAWETLVQGQAVTDIEPFAERIQILGKEYGYPPLSDWGDQLQVQARTFQMDLLPR
jgi:ligand-binding sensor domain-containing protein